ncbi:glycosyl hydrolase [Amycolatopsis sp. K13G38]|uniref:Glycosyl hydrolase n=1 Tax=Amycolatopsis acididurans TaxID=2724524 RepID=A0ABX1J1A9_9PSEU|nr:glycoside hydrolase family 64 protein [Amycolatopsis acididurans]NKQ53562.1 glycosyl hydrolase [Amycolatopsis acididurans]
MPNRRSVLKGLGVALVGAPVGAAFAAGQISGRGASAAGTALPLTIVNHSNRYANSQVWYYIVGTNLATGQQSFVSPNGTLTPVLLSLNGPDGFADLSIPLAAGGDTTLAIPPDMSGRVYFSLGGELKFKAVTDGAGNSALQYPAGWVSGDPSYTVLHDCVEFTHNSSGMFCNTTMVDMFSVPLSITLKGAATQTTGTLVSGGRANIFNAIKANSTFAPLVVGDLRVIAPGHGIDTGIFPADYFGSSIDQVWSKYSGQQLTVETDSGTYTGQVSGGTFNFSGGVASFAKPSTRDVFYCDGALAAPNDGRTGPVAAVLGAAFNRSTLLSRPNQPVADPGTFYQDAVTNHYSKAMHANTVDGKAYGFPFDDVLSFASYIQDTAPTGITIELTPF